MKERPRWTPMVIEGGKSVEKNESHSEKPITPSMLVEEWILATSMAPKDFGESIKPEAVARRREEVASWAVEELYAYLLRGDKWSHPDYTRAVMDEVKHRMEKQEFEPLPPPQNVLRFPS